MHKKDHNNISSEVDMRLLRPWLSISVSVFKVISITVSVSFLRDHIGVGTGGPGAAPDFFVLGGPIWPYPPLLKNAAPSLS